MGAIPESVRTARKQVLAQVLGALRLEFADFVTIKTAFTVFESRAEGMEKIGSLGGFAQFVRNAGLPTTKMSNRVHLVLDEAVDEFVAAFGPGVSQSGQDLDRKLAQAPSARPLAPTSVRGGAHPLRVDTTTVLHAMAEGHEMMFDLAGRSELEVTEHVRERLERLSEARPDERKVLTLELLAGSMALAGAVA